MYQKQKRQSRKGRVNMWTLICFLYVIYQLLKDAFDEKGTTCFWVGLIVIGVLLGL